MAQITLNVGSNANDGTGDTLRVAMTNINTMLTELYAASPVTSQITFDGNEIKTNQSNANLKLTASGTGVIELEGIQIRDNHIEGTRSNEDLVITPSGTGDLILGAIRIHGTNLSADDSSSIKIAETLNVNTIASDDSSAVHIADSLNIGGGLLIAGGDTTTQDLVVEGNLSLNTMSSDDSSQILIDDGVRISGTLTAPIIDVNELSSSDSTAIQINDSVNISGTLKAGNIEGITVLSHSDQSDGTVTHSGSSGSQPLDSFAAGTYRSAKYNVSITDSTNSRFAMDEVFVTHDGSSAYISSTGVSSTGSSLVTYSADISDGNVRVLMVPISSDSVTYKFIRIAIDV